MDDLLKRTGGDVSKIEKELGIPDGRWRKEIKNGDKLIRIDIDKSQIKGLDMPKGTESTANDLWLPGGKNSGGFHEAVLDNMVITHNNDINNLKNYFPIKEYK